MPPTAQRATIFASMGVSTAGVAAKWWVCLCWLAPIPHMAAESARLVFALQSIAVAVLFSVVLGAQTHSPMPKHRLSPPPRLGGLAKRPSNLPPLARITLCEAALAGLAVMVS